MAANVTVGNKIGWGNVKVALFGRQVIGITAISYKKKSEKELLYGAGREPLGVGIGNNSYEGSITMYRYEVDAILAGARDKNKDADLSDISTFTISVGRAMDDGGFQTDHISAQFMESGSELKQGDKMDMVELPLLVTGITFNA